MGAILDFQDYCEIETDGATDVTVVPRHGSRSFAGAGTMRSGALSWSPPDQSRRPLFTFL
jgi:hypothetical protein